MTCLDTCLVASIIAVFNIIFGIGWTLLILTLFVLIQVLIQKSCFGRQVEYFAMFFLRMPSYLKGAPSPQDVCPGPLF